MTVSVTARAIRVRKSARGARLWKAIFADRFIKSAPRIVASFNELKAENRNAVEPPILCLNAGCHYSPDQKLQWIEVVNFSGSGNSRTLVPLESVAVYPAHAAEIAAENLLFRPITNGLGAGASLAQAVAHGALEIVSA